MTFPDSALLMKSCTFWRSSSSSLLWSLFLFSCGICQKKEDVEGTYTLLRNSKAEEVALGFSVFLKTLLVLGLGLLSTCQSRHMMLLRIYSLVSRHNGIMLANVLRHVHLELLGCEDDSHQVRDSFPLEPVVVSELQANVNLLVVVGVLLLHFGIHCG
jgi:hypothetical protein